MKGDIFNNKWHLVSPTKIRAFRVISPLTINNISFDRSFIVLFKGWFTLANESEAEYESEVQETLQSSVNQKPESQVEAEARRNRSQKDQKSFFWF